MHNVLLLSERVNLQFIKYFLTINSIVPPSNRQGRTPYYREETCLITRAHLITVTTYNTLTVCQELVTFTY